MTRLFVPTKGTQCALSGMMVVVFLAVLLLSCVYSVSYAQGQPSKAQPPAASNAPGNGKSPGLTLSQMTRDAEVIVVGKVTDTRSEWNGDRTRIYTRVTVSVDEYLKGDQSQKTVTLLNLGGEVGTEGEIYNEVPVFRKDEEILVFAGKDRQGNLRVVGGKQGKAVVTAGKTAGTKMVGVNRSLDDVKREIKDALNKGQ